MNAIQVLTIVGAVLTIVGALVGAVLYIAHEMNARFSGIAHEMNARFSATDKRIEDFRDHFDALLRSGDKRIDDLRSLIVTSAESLRTEMKTSLAGLDKRVARIEDKLEHPVERAH